MSVLSFPWHNLRLKGVTSWAILEKYKAKIIPNRARANDNKADLFKHIILFQ